jgi:hypothetical protein
MPYYTPHKDPIPYRSKSAPSTFEGFDAAATPPLPSPGIRTITNQGDPDPQLGAFDDDIRDPTAFRDISTLVAALLKLPNSSYRAKDGRGIVRPDRVIVRMAWVKQVVSEKHFIFDPAKGRSVLRGDSKIRTHGLEYGLPKRYYGWLCGEEVDGTEFYVGRDVMWLALSELY